MQQTEKYKFNLPNDFEDRFSTDPMNENMKKVERELARVDAADAALQAAMGSGSKTCRIATGFCQAESGQLTIKVDFKPYLIIVSDPLSTDNYSTYIMVRGGGCPDRIGSRRGDSKFTWTEDGVIGKGQIALISDVRPFIAIGESF